MIPCCCAPCAAVQLLNETSDAPIGRGATKGECQDKHAREWHNGLFGCFTNIGHGCYACFCPRCANASAASEFDGSNCCYNCLLKNPCTAQSIIREGPAWGHKEGYNIKGNCWGDLCLPIWCHCCAITRLLNEVRHPKCGNINEHEINSNQQANKSVSDGGQI
jgi:Cys-rich protein (TIGR01571 family)